MTRTRFVLGVDLGGTKISVGAMPADGSRHFALHSKPTLADEGADAVVERIVEMIETAIAQTIAETGAARAKFEDSGDSSSIQPSM
jgi:predicted NBD/HSP70 family sugar kinase